MTWWERDDFDNRARGNSMTAPKLNDVLQRKVVRLMCGTTKAAGGARVRKESIRGCRKRLREEEKVEVSYGTIQSCISSYASYRVRRKKVRLSEDYAQRRFDWADDHVGWDVEAWKRLLNTDSSPFYLNYATNRRNDGTWCRPGEAPPISSSDKYCLKTEVYVGVSYRGLTPPEFIDSPDRVNAKNYISDILPTMAAAVSERKTTTNDPTTTRLFADTADWCFQQDLARPHIAAITQQYLTDNVPEFWLPEDTPPKLFEWPIEQFWNELDRRLVKRGRAKDLKQLKKWIRVECKKEYWFEWLRNTWDTFPRRVKAVCEAEGWHTDN